MSMSAATRPCSPSIGMACSQRRCPGNSPKNAETKSRSKLLPRVFSSGEITARDLNQRTPRLEKMTGKTKTEIPKNCNSRSLDMAPASPIQLLVVCEGNADEAVFSDGSSGEYEASARKRSAEKTSRRKPISSLSRRFFVGVKTRVK